TLQVGTSSYAISGSGVAVAAIDALIIQYVDTTGVRLTAQPATPIDFSQTVVGSTTAHALTFTATNPTTSFDAVPVPVLAVTGQGYSFANAPSAPLSIQPGQSVTFKIIFAPSA